VDDCPHLRKKYVRICRGCRRTFRHDAGAYPAPPCPHCGKEPNPRKEPKPRSRREAVMLAALMVFWGVVNGIAGNAWVMLLCLGLAALPGWDAMTRKKDETPSAPPEGEPGEKTVRLTATPVAPEPAKPVMSASQSAPDAHEETGCGCLAPLIRFLRS
jgi:hypothetical protein